MSSPGGSLTLLFEAGKPCASPPIDLGELDALTFERVTGQRSTQLSTVGGERRLTVRLVDRRMSRVHAHLRRVSTGWSLEDARSRNGTRVNGNEIESALLGSGDLVEIGRSFFAFRDDATAMLGPDPVMQSLGLATRNPALARHFHDLLAIAPSAIPIIVHGETGTGKEVIAQAIHRLSGRSGPLQAVNCGALSRSLLESELFGYKKGAFSGASEDRPGVIRAADRGTLLLDEIGDLPLDCQAALLRVLQEGELVPVGGVKPVRIDVRVVAATHRDLGDMVAREAFRADLFARLNGFTVALPPLRARREDLGALLHSLVERHAPARAGASEFSAAAIQALYAYSWPGNIRELEKTVATALVLAAGGPIEIEQLPAPMRTASLPPLAPGSVESDGSDPQRDRLARLLARHRGNVNAIARALNTSRTQVHRLCQRFGLDPGGHRSKR